MVHANKSERQARDRKILAGIRRYLAKKTVTLNGTPYASRELEALVQGELDALDEIDAAHAKFRAAVTKHALVQADLKPVLAAMKSYVALRFGDTSQAFADFGFTPRRTGRRTVDVKAQAVEKLRATRAAQNTPGPRERVHVPVAVSPSAPAKAPPPI